jgi:large subunit ribosomal protein L10e
MARLRRGIAYRTLERAYTRYSKFKNRCFVKSRPVCKVVRFDMGKELNDYEYCVELISKQSIQIRDNALESARQAGNRELETTLGKDSYHLRVRKYPHHILRENPLAAGAGADRLSTGMAHAFGKVIGIAAQIKIGDPLFTLKIKAKDLPVARTAMRQMSLKLPKSYYIVEKKLKAKAKPTAA